MRNPDININVRSDGGRAHVSMTATRGREEAQIGTTLTRENAVRVVEAICQCAGLPQPWKKT